MTSFCTAHFRGLLSPVVKISTAVLPAVTPAVAQQLMVAMGAAGQEVALRAAAFGMAVIAFGNYWPDDFARALSPSCCPRLFACVCTWRNLQEMSRF